MADAKPSIHPGLKIAGVILIALFAFVGGSVLTMYFSRNGQSGSSQAAQASPVAVASEVAQESFTVASEVAPESLAVASEATPAPSTSAKSENGVLTSGQMVTTNDSGFLVACESASVLHTFTGYAFRGEKNKMKAMLSNMDCFALPEGKQFKILSVKGGVVEIVPADSGSTEGLWTVKEAVRLVTQ